MALAAIHGRVGLAKALGWSITDLLGLERLLGVNPLASANNLNQLVDTARQLQTFGISSVELRSRLEAPDAAQLPPWALAESAITSRLQALQATLLQAKKQHVSPYQENLETLEQLETLERALQTVPAAGNDAITAIRELLRAETPSTTQVSASKGLVDGPLVGLVQAATIKGRIDALAVATDEAGREVERQAIIKLILGDLAAAALLQEARQATANTLVELLALSGEQAEVLLDRLTLTVGASAQTLAGLFIPQSWLSGATTPTPWLASHVSPASAPNLYRAVRLAQAVVGLLPISSLTPEVLDVLLRREDALYNQGWLRLRDVPFEPSIPAISPGRWLVLRAGLALLERFPAVQDPARPGSTVSALDLLQLALTSSTTKAQLLSALALVTGWPLARLQVLDTHYALALADYAKPATWAQLETAISLLNRMGASLPEALTLAAGTLNPAASQLARRLLRARYDEAEWLPALKSLMDPIRERKRDALITHLLAINPGLKSRLDVYDVFLTDPEWSARMPSSRLVQAHSTVQLFIRRCLEGLEPKAVADLSDQDWKQWEWMKNYRVWEVARKVFVDAQYYLKPEWRDDKTEIFTEFESTLQQKELNEENVNAAFEGYLDRLDQIAFLDVLATCYDLQNYSLHVIAATKGGEPRLYFHRRLDRERFWTPWTKIDLDISGDHLIAFFRNQRLHLAWATFLEKGNEEQSLPFPQQGSDNQPLPRAQRRLEISLAVSEFTGKRWLPRRVSRDAITTPWAEEPIDRATLQLTVNPDPERFTVDLYRNPGVRQALLPIGSFLLT
ncbi:MAG: neuraminidase-like domain-containing protein, partial [Cyanobacteriota bacterium]